MKSHSVYIEPIDERCRYWAKIVRANQDLPMPCDVFGANDIPGPYLALGDDELLPGDVLFEGEANHHRRRDRGWSYTINIVTLGGDLLTIFSGFSAQKTELKSQRMTPELLRGAGDVAAMVRIAHGVRAGMEISGD